jgi:hypothetical protein
MISSAYKFIYLHTPKTAGNSIQSLLLPLSDDAKTYHEDTPDFLRSSNTFEVIGEITTHKHVGISCYAEALGSKLSDYKIIISRP